MNTDTPNILSRNKSFCQSLLPLFSMIFGIVYALSALSSGTALANPFTRKNTDTLPQHQDNTLEPAPEISKSPASSPKHPHSNIMERIIFFQMKIKKKMTTLIRQAQKTGETTPLLWVLAAAFAYGVVHSAGPGHGKALALSYIVSIKPGLPRALAFGNLLAVSHGLSGAALVFCVKYLLDTSMSGALGSVTRITQITSYSLIIVLGLFLFLRKLPVWKKFKPEIAAPVEASGATLDIKSLVPALFIGMIPCPGVVLVVLFCLSLGLPGFGIMMACAITLGMASTLSLVVLIAMAGKTAVLAPLSRRVSFVENAGDVLEALAGLILSAISLMLLLTLFSH
ncbi:MAG: hypothetical protein MI799_23970 [Desulfobacterales bacterium]|nr:hypothetical protein [Desulfobacterales bacterium]